jgi:hypothetical protein
VHSLLVKSRRNNALMSSDTHALAPEPVAGCTRTSLSTLVRWKCHNSVCLKGPIPWVLFWRCSAFPCHTPLAPPQRLMVRSYDAVHGSWGN